jgi:hypothetical protein
MDSSFTRSKKGFLSSSKPPPTPPPRLADAQRPKAVESWPQHGVLPSLAGGEWPGRLCDLYCVDGPCRLPQQGLLSC